jgi:uncharacterized membrane protein
MNATPDARIDQRAPEPGVATATVGAPAALPSAHHLVGQSSARVEALADGVFAIAMTILVFDLQLPESDQPLAQALRALAPKLLSFALSFALLGIYWAGHRGQFHYIRHADHVLHWINILLFALVSLVPFSAKVLGRHSGTVLGQALYGANLIAIGVVLYWHWRHASRRHLLIDQDVPAAVVRGAIMRCLVAPACYLVAVGVAVLDTRVSLVMFLCVPALYILPWLQGFWWSLSGARGGASPAPKG